MSPPLTAEQLSLITSTTIHHYDENAIPFWEGTRDHDVTQNYEALLSRLPQAKKLTLLDFGCGPGRDLAYFRSLGHDVTGVDGSAELCRMARDYSGCQVLQQNFLALDLPREHFHGIFANASLFHIPGQELPRVLSDLAASLVPGGVLFSSNPRGGNTEGWNGDRYGHYWEIEPYQALLQSAGLEVLDHYYRPTGKPRAEQPWLAVVSRRPA